MVLDCIGGAWNERIDGNADGWWCCEKGNDKALEVHRFVDCSCKTMHHRRKTYQRASVAVEAVHSLSLNGPNNTDMFAKNNSSKQSQHTK